MPATTRVETNGSEPIVDLTEEAPVEEHAAVEETEGSHVTEYLDLALTAASDEGMSAAELMGLFYYYAHSIAESYRHDLMANEAPPE